MALGKLSAVIFDMDGVLLDTERVGMRAWMDAALEHGSDLTPEVYAGLIGLDRAGVDDYLARHGWDSPAIRRLERTAWAKYLEALARDGVPVKSGMFEVLDFLDARSIPCAVATSTQTAIAEHKLEQVGVRGRFQTIVGGDQVSMGKPAPDIYLLAAERLRCLPAACAALEDSGPGIRAAAAAGMKVIWVPDLCEVDLKTQELAYAAAQSLSDAIQLIERLADNLSGSNCR
jgi:HAD superfamily hydrolase (TIGR01509 family)